MRTASVKRNTAIAIIVLVPIALGAAYAISPYFTESMINEELPASVLDREPASEPLTVEEMADMVMPDTAPLDEPMPEEMTEEQVVRPDLVGEFVGVGDGVHDARGVANVYELDGGGTILRLEDFYSTNGPGLRVYLAVDKQASDYISLGELKANSGNQNYEIPDGTDLERYDQVLIWCEPFRVLFGSAEISRT